MTAIRTHRAMLKLLEGQIDFRARHDEESLANALTFYKEVFQAETDLTLRIRALRLIYEAMTATPALAAGAPAIAELADKLTEEKELSECAAGLIADDDELWS